MRVCFCVRVQATPCVTFWSVRGATVSHTLTLHGATASTAHSPSQDQHIAPLLLHHRSSFNTFFFLFLCAILTLNCPTNTSFPVYMISTQSCQIRWWENRSEIVLELLLLCNIGFRYVKPYWSIIFHIEMCLMYFYNIQIHICQLISIVSEKKSLTWASHMFFPTDFAENTCKIWFILTLLWEENVASGRDWNSSAVSNTTALF